MRALWSSVGAVAGAVALIVLLGSPPAATDATAPFGAADTERSTPLPKAQARFLTSTAVAEALAWAPDAVQPTTLFPAGEAPFYSEPHVRAEGRAPAPQIFTDGVPREFYFSRVRYRGFRGFYGRRGGTWATDFPKADQIFLSFIDRLLPNLDAYEREFVVDLDNPDLRRFPFLYALEVGAMSLSPPEIEGLRGYLLAGGFLVIDDFWGTYEWQNFEYEIRQVLPEYEIVDLSIDHNIFTTFYEIEEILQVPNVGNGVRGGPTYERDGFVPVVRGIHDDNGRLMVIINWNTDLGDAWEWADNPQYPLRYSTYAYEMGVNFIVYAMSH